jgi:hypothetical protein
MIKHELSILTGRQAASISEIVRGSSSADN